MDTVLVILSDLFDRVEAFWKKIVVRRYLGPVMVLVYLLALGVIELKRRGILPPGPASLIPDSHFEAIHVAFTFLLFFEVIELIFGLSRSVSRALGKQLEIFAIILLRNCFKSFSGVEEPISWAGMGSHILPFLSSAFGALAIILLLVVYYRMHQSLPIWETSEKRQSFIGVKKGVSLVLFLVFVAIGVFSLVNLYRQGELYPFFPVFFTVLILCDILLVLISLGYSSWFPVVFRNSGFAVATVLLRVGITAPAYYDVGLGIAAAVYAMGITLAYNLFAGMKKQEH
ncbi:MAG: hypothetical protein V1793_00080 [Pseudomonadota bacterium]